MSTLCIPVYRDAVFDPFDDFGVLARSMRELSKLADRLEGDLADAQHPAGGELAASKNKASKPKKPAPSKELEIKLQPRVDWLETSDEILIVAATPGLAKQHLSVDVVSEAGARFVEIRGETPQPAPSDDSDKDKAAAKPPALSYVYPSFAKRVRLPADADVESLVAKYEDGVLRVSGGRVAKPQGERRQISIS